MLSHPSADVTDRFRRRLDAAFAARGLRLDDHVRLLPRLAHADYLALNHAADVFLDSLEFSAGRSGFEALAMGLVPVTTRGRFARGRYLAAALTALGHDALIADDENEYVALALALAHDPARRATLSRDLRARAGRPFDGHAVLAAFQRFLEVATPSKVLAAASPA
jgi:predicted O-linked N-acetylglucosamine transferase (SPINDLY family)